MISFASEGLPFQEFERKTRCPGMKFSIGYVLVSELFSVSHFRPHKSMRASIVRIVGNEVIVEFPEDVESDSTVRGGHFVVGLK